MWIGRSPFGRILLRAGRTLLVALFFALPALADFTAEATISTNHVGTGEPFKLLVTVGLTSQDADLPWPEVENLEAFSVTKTKAASQSSETTIINGRISQSTRYLTVFTYTLTASRPGSYPVGPIRYRYANSQRNLGSTVVQVEKREPGIRLLPSLSKSSVFVGEQLTFTLRIVPGPGVQKISRPEIQKLIGEKFWFQHLDENIEAKTVKLDGQDTRVFDVRIVLFPLLAGPVDLPGIPVEYEQSTRTRRRTGSVFDFFEDDFFGGGTQTLSATSPGLKLRVESLPTPAPREFSGSIGNYSLAAGVDKTSLPSGDALTLTVTIKGDGQPNSINRPQLPDLPDFEIYDPEITEKTQVQGSTLLTAKTFKYVLVPRRSGSRNIDPIKFHFFDPKKRSYSIAASDRISIEVTPGKDLPEPAGVVLSQREITELGSDIRHIKSSEARLEMENDFLYKRVWIWLLFGLPPLGLVGLRLVHKRREKLESDAGLRRRLGAGTESRKRLQQARKAQDSEDGREFHRLLWLAVEGFLSDKLITEFKGLTPEQERVKLSNSGASAETRTLYENLKQQCDFAQFAGGRYDDKARQKAYDDAVTLLKRLEKELRQ